MPTNTAIHIFTFFNDTAIIGIHSCRLEPSRLLHLHINELETGKWKIRANPEKRDHVTFTLRKNDCNYVKIRIPQHNRVKYFIHTIFGSATYMVQTCEIKLN